MVKNETKYMEVAIALSEELNFTRAAKRVGISQSAITKIVRELEHTIGLRLFERDRQHVRVTDACRAYVEQARLSLLYAERAFQVAKTVAHGADTLQHVGKSPYADPFLVSLLQSIEIPLFPRLKLQFKSQYSFDLIRELLAGTLDLAIANEPPDSPLLSSIKIAEAPYFIGMLKEDSLAKRASVTPIDLDGRRLIIFERRLHPPVYDSIMGRFEQGGIRFKDVHHVITPEEAFPLISDGSSVAFLVKASAVRLSRSGVTIRPFLDEDLILKTYLVSRADNESRITSELVRGFIRRLETLNRAHVVAAAQA